MGAQGTRAIEAAKRAGVTYTVHEYAHDARSSRRDGGRGYAVEAVEALGIDASRVFKTIVVAVDGRLGVAIVPADAEVDLKAVADALGGRKAAIASPADAEKATGYVLGGISPLGTRRALPTAWTRPRPRTPRSTSRPAGAAWRSSWPRVTSSRWRAGSSRRSRGGADRRSRRR